MVATFMDLWRHKTCAPSATKIFQKQELPKTAKEDKEPQQVLMKMDLSFSFSFIFFFGKQTIQITTKKKQKVQYTTCQNTSH